MLPWPTRIGIIEQSVTPQAQIVREEALTRLLVEKGIFTKEEFLEMVKVVKINLTKKGESNETSGKAFIDSRGDSDLFGTFAPNDLQHDFSE